MKVKSLQKHIFYHELEHTGKSFECHLCKNTYARFHGLQSHFQQKHRNFSKRKYECKHCGKRHQTQNELDDHIRNVCGDFSFFFVLAFI